MDIDAISNRKNSNKLKYLPINLIKDVYTIFEENYIILSKAIKET